MLQARRLGKELLVGVHSDEEIKDNKGPTVMTLKERYAFKYIYQQYRCGRRAQTVDPVLLQCLGGQCLSMVVKGHTLRTLRHVPSLDLSLRLSLRRSRR